MVDHRYTLRSSEQTMVKKEALLFIMWK
jgi:hypothetical protein